MLARQAALGPPLSALAVVRSAAGHSGPDRPGRAAGSLRRAAGDLRLRPAPGALLLASPGEKRAGLNHDRGRAGRARPAVRACPGRRWPWVTAAASQGWQTCTQAWMARSTQPTWLVSPEVRAGRRLGGPGVYAASKTLPRSVGGEAELPRRRRAAGRASRHVPADPAVVSRVRGRGPQAAALLHITGPRCTGGAWPARPNCCRWTCAWRETA